jgi:hypothetical protein
LVVNRVMVEKLVRFVRGLRHDLIPLLRGAEAAIPGYVLLL